MVLILSFFLVGCFTDQPNEEKDKFVGNWTSSFWIESLNKNMEFRLYLQSDKTCESYNSTLASLSGDTLYDKGFTGRWEAEVDTVSLFPETCYKGDTLGVKTVNTCAEDYNNEYYQFVYTQNSLRIGSGSAQMIYTKY